jgi:LmbE family N-acetylglucosaminyl deacetylase
VLPLPRGSSSRVLGIFAHPDDESYFAGATLATYAAHGCAVELVTFSGGEAAGPQVMESYANACLALGVGVGSRVGQWQDLGPRVAPGSLAHAPFSDVVSAVKDVLTAASADVVLTVGPDGVTSHPDHVRMHEAVAAALPARVIGLGACIRQWAYEAGTSRLANLAPGKAIGDGGIRGVSGDVLAIESPDASAAAKRAALDCYHSGLGTAPLETLVGERIGDGHVLRAIYEAEGMHVETFRRL